MLPFLTIQNIRSCIESYLDEYIIPTKILQGNTHDMIIEKLTSSSRAYVSAKKKKKTNYNTNNLMKLRDEHAYTKYTYLELTSAAPCFSFLP